MKRIVFFIGEFNGGGAERVISILSNALVNKNYNVSILKYYESENLYSTDSRVNILSVCENTRSRNIFVNIIWLIKYFRNNADVVISFLAKFNMLALFANIFSNKPIIVCDRNDPRYTPTNSVIRFFRNLLYRFADKVVLQTEHNKEYFNYIKEKCVVISNPIDLGEYIGKALKIEKEDLIVSVGRLEPQKNQLILIEAFKEIKNIFPNYKLKIFGEGSYRQTLENKIKELELNDSVLLPGQTNKIFDEMCKAKLFVLPSNYEGMPNVLIEAMCLGLPCISTNVSGANELISDGDNGYVIDRNNADQLKEKMLFYLNNENIRNIHGNRATQISEKLKVDSIVDKWTCIIESMVRKG